MDEALKFHQRINVTQPKLPDLNEYKKYLDSIWEKKWLTNNGPLHEMFKEKLAQQLNVDNVELFTNGHQALEIAIKSLNLTGEVITTPFTFASTTHAIVNNGLTPVFCDIEKSTFNIDANQIEKYITDKTSAIIAVHVFGSPCDVVKIQQIADKYNLKVIYDAAHALFVTINGKSIASFGDISMFSFHATKVFHSIEGGMLAYKDKNLETKLKALKNFGITSEDTVEYVGTNAKMNEFQAAMGLCNLNSIKDDIEKRKKIFQCYVNNLSELKNVQVLPQQNNVKHNYSYFPILLESNEVREFLYEKLKEYNVFARKYFSPLTSSFDCYNFVSSTPNAEDITNRILTLPMYTDFALSDVEQICHIIRYELGEFH